LALQSFLRGWYIENAVPLHRLTAAISAVQILKGNKDWLQASRMGVDGVRLLPVANSRYLSRQDQQYVVSHFSGLAVDACSLLLMRAADGGEVVAQALQILKLGRGAISNLLIDNRRDLSDLRAEYPDNADNFERLRMQLNTSTPEADART
jgi:hypothetical protein